ncbi:MAG: T9SS type A sorting domain-containing protein [Bacteroidetes bacterium]|nr:T9SS type A sorting domain-containing protein [Bacteroidota bacterium]
MFTTSNSGLTWTIKYRFPNNIISALHMYDRDSGLIAVTNGTNSSKLYKTTNQGTLWTIVLNSTAGDINDLQLMQNGNGILAGTNGLVMKTTDYGNSWSPLSIGTGDDIVDVSMPTTNDIFLASTSSIYISTNGGSNFSSITNPGQLNGANLLSLDFGNGLKGVAGCEYGNVYITDDGGMTWSTYTSFPWFNVNTVFANSGSNYIIGGSYGALEKTNNSGTNWTDLCSRISENALQAVKTVNSTTAFAAGFGGTILTTSNAGASWTTQNSNAGGEDLYDIHFVNTTTGLAIGTNGTIVKTTDGGVNWNFIFSGISEHLYGIAPDASGKIYVCGADGKLAYSTNNGDTWTDFPTSFTGQGYNFKEIQCFGTDSIVIATDQPYLINTYDNGLSWNLVNNGSAFECTAMFFRNAMNGWVGTYIGEIYSTTDGGTSWNLDVQPTSNEFVGCIKFADPQNGWFVSGNEIYRTASGGAAWSREINPNQDPIQDIDILSGTKALAVGNGLANILARNNDMQLSLPSYTLCTDNSYTLAINAIGTWNLGNQFRIELSDEFGDFSFPTTLGTVSATGTTPVQITVPNGLTDGSDYLIRVFSSRPPMWSPVNSLPLTVRTSPDAYIAPGGPTSFCIGSSVTLYAFTGSNWTYQWYKDGVLLSGATADSLVVDSTGDYTVQTSDGFCSLTSPITDVLVVNCSGIAENGNQLFYKVYPNPSRDVITLENMEYQKIDRIQISDIMGRIVKTISNINAQQMEISVSDLSNGIYHITILGERPALVKFIKM